MSTINSKNVQVGTSNVAAENFTLYQPNTPDGTVRLGVGNSGATTADVVTVNSAGMTVTGVATATTFSGSGASLTALNGTNISSGTVATARLPAGTMLQVVSTTKSDVFTTTSASYVDVTGLSATITPTNASSKILVIANLSYSASSGRDAAFQILRGATVIPTGVTGSVLNGAYTFSMFSVAQSYLDSPATTSATTYKIQVYVSADTIFINRRALDTSFTGQSTITLMEIAA